MRCGRFDVKERDDLRLAFVREGEIFAVEVVNDFALRVADDDANENEVDTDFESRGRVVSFDFGLFCLLRLRRGRGWRLWLGGLILFLSGTEQRKSGEAEQQP